MTGTIDEISQAIGRLEGKIDAVIEEQKYARLVRNEMANQLQTIPGISHRVDSLEDSLERTQETVRSHEDIVQRGVGIYGILSVFCGVVGAGIVLAIQWLLGKH